MLKIPVVALFILCLGFPAAHAAEDTPPNFLFIAVDDLIIALPVLPISYTYAIYKRQLGQLEFRANRLLGLYSFILIFPSLFIML